MDRADIPKPTWRAVPMPEASATLFVLEQPVSDKTLERMARFACEWENADPDASLSGDGVNFLWMEARDTLIVPLLALLDEAE